MRLSRLNKYTIQVQSEIYKETKTMCLLLEGTVAIIWQSYLRSIKQVTGCFLFDIL